MEKECVAKRSICGNLSRGCLCNYDFPVSPERFACSLARPCCVWSRRLLSDVAGGVNEGSKILAQDLRLSTVPMWAATTGAETYLVLLPLLVL